ncbi:hypothetical protein A4A49_08329 [Nicotiana attenuata]|uniref:Uncharacterized protein n=1 Tax=Nicotiana attenuata TaxID=49451 RepID=A0A1J6J757_NICAT|nr:hypothetical protein A4A49_08329 [Nicotiana attenuata]
MVEGCCDLLAKEEGDAPFIFFSNFSPFLSPISFVLNGLSLLVLFLERKMGSGRNLVLPLPCVCVCVFGCWNFSGLKVAVDGVFLFLKSQP